MSILSDHSIYQLCMPPTHRVLGRDTPNRFGWDGFSHPEGQLEIAERTGFAARITPEEATRYGWEPMVVPFSPQQHRCDDQGNRQVSWGLSSFGYDVRLANQFKIFTNVRSTMIDPLVPDDGCFIDHEGDHCIIPPNSYILGHTVETFKIPKDVMVVCVGKSTYARLAAIVNVTPIEPGFEGQVVIEIANASTLPLKVYANQGIAQFLFFQGDRECTLSYADRAGKYQGQQGITTARV